MSANGAGAAGCRRRRGPLTRRRSYWITSTASGVKNIPAKPGERVVLPCEADRDVEHVEWRRGTNPVCICDNNNRVCNAPPPSFENRVQLNNTLTSGDVSLILKNVTQTDAGKYECSATLSGGKRTKRSVNLKVELGDTSGGAKAGPGAAVTLSLLVVVGGVFFDVYKKTFSPQ